MKLLRSCNLNILQWQRNPKYAVVLLYLILYMWFETHGMADFGRELGYPVRPWLFPLLPCTPDNFIPLFLAYVLLISDAPFRNRQQQFVLQRVGKRIWVGGQLLYIFFIGAVFTLIVWLLSWIFLLPNLEWGADWGPVLTTAAVAGGHNLYTPLALVYGAMKGTSPGVATFYVFWMMVAVCFLLGEIMVLCNLWMKKGIGTVIVGGFAIIPLVISVFAHTPRFTKKLIWISPVSWLDRSIMGHANQNLPSYGYAAGMTVGLSILLAVIIVGTIHKCNLETDKE